MTSDLAPPKKITNLFSNCLKGIPKKDLIQTQVGGMLRACYGLYGICEMTLCLTNRKLHHFGSSMITIMGATGWRRLRIFSASAVGGRIIESIVDVSLLPSCFDLPLVNTSIDPMRYLSCNNCDINFAIK
jgi:hypothetical protein